MTQLGKCDTCRARKVKCDEEKPVCGACSKKNRPCTYSYGKATKLVREDPNQFSGHGKAKRAPVVYPLISPDRNVSSGNSYTECLKLTTEKEVGAGDGVFQTFTLNSKKRNASNQQLILARSTSPSTIDSNSSSEEPWYTIPLQPTCPATSLANRYVNMLGPQIFEFNPLSMHGSWIDSIPSRIGSSPILDLAVEYAVDAFSAHVNPNFSTRKTALIGRSKALKALRKGLSQHQGIPNYDILLSTKLHSYAEIFVAIGAFAYTYHCLGLSELLKSGCVNGMDWGSYWSLVNNTYGDEASEALCCGRYSIYDTEHWRARTHPLSLDASVKLSSEFYIESSSIMHVFIQLPRLCCLIRTATLGPEDPKALPAAIALSKSLWNIDPGPLFDHLLQNFTTVVPTPADPAIADIITETRAYDSIQAILVCTRYWMHRVFFCGLLQTLTSHFPQECADARLPTFETVQQSDIDTAICIAQTLASSLSFDPSMPLVPLRILQPLSSSVGSWYRAAKYAYKRIKELPTDSPDYTVRYAELKDELKKAVRMEGWIIDQCNSIHELWSVDQAEGGAFELMVDSMAGGPIVEWLVRKADWDEIKDQIKLKRREWDV